ncbi:MAG: hypothetical protein JOS17DRAFT_741346 [Linnemannia elongata]|nr:MAG: hypothetical protein JOS17DRAFT_741346 [Linnemannia elongata]
MKSLFIQRKGNIKNNGYGKENNQQACCSEECIRQKKEIIRGLVKFALKDHYTQMKEKREKLKKLREGNHNTPHNTFAQSITDQRRTCSSCHSDTLHQSIPRKDKDGPPCHIRILDQRHTCSFHRTCTLRQSNPHKDKDGPSCHIRNRASDHNDMALYKYTCLHHRRSCSYIGLLQRERRRGQRRRSSRPFRIGIVGHTHSCYHRCRRCFRKGSC